MIQDLWTKYKNLKWYYKILLFVPIVLILGLIYSISAANTSITQKLLKIHKSYTDKKIKDFSTKELIEESKRKDLEDKQSSLKAEITKTELQINQSNTKLDNQLKEINSIDSIEELKSMFDNLRKQSK